MDKRQWHKEDIVETTITSLTFEGQGVARVGGMVLFVRGGVPGDAVRVRLTKIRKSFAEGEVIDITQPSPWRVAARCPHFGVCGGCASQNLSYDRQLANKAQQIREAIEHIGGLDVEVLPTLGMPEPWHYRNKMEFAFGEGDGGPYLGLMERASYERVTEIEQCFLATPRMMQAARRVETFARSAGLYAYRPRDRTGTLRHLVVREGRRTGDLMLNLVTTSAVNPSTTLASAVADLAPTTVLWSHNDTWGSVVRGDRVTVLSGSGNISERIGHLTLIVGPFSFLQTNSEMVEVLYATIAGQAALTGSETVLDLYCGVGSIGLYLARQARRVVGIESVAEAINDARQNAEQNNITNARFECAAVEDLSTLTYGAINPDVIVIDPPRAGLHPRLLAELRALAAPRLVYVSCNPAALARDLKALSDVYRIGRVQPVDMFPHTWHVESVVALTKRG